MRIFFVFFFYVMRIQKNKSGCAYFFVFFFMRMSFCVFLVCASHICVMRIPKKHKKTQKDMRMKKNTKNMRIHFCFFVCA